MKKMIIIFTLLLFGLSIYAYEIYFLSGSFDLSEESLQKITKFKNDYESFFKDNPSTIIIITGYTDNVGSEQSNRKLSKRRAEIIQEYLLKELQMKPENIQVFGRGSDNPLASNTTEEGRILNRRVEIEFENPEANIKWLQNKVEYISSKSGKKETAQPQAALFQYDKINTEDNSRSGIEFRDLNMVILEENSMMIIFGDISSEYSKLLDNKFHVELKYGRLFNKLQNLGGKSINVKTPAADLELFSASNDIAFENDQTLASIYEGYGMVFAQGKSVTVNEGFGVKIEKGKEPQTPVQLPITPTELSILSREIVVGKETVLFTWKGETFEYLIQFSNDESFESIALEQTVQTNEFESIIAPASYFARVRALDANGLKSNFSSSIAFTIDQPELIKINRLIENETIETPYQNFTIKGETLEGVKLFINKTAVQISENYTFSKTLSLDYGKNNINIIATGSDKVEKEFQYFVAYEPFLNKDLDFKELKQGFISVAQTEDFSISTEAPIGTRFYIAGAEIQLNEDGKLNYQIKLQPGENKIVVKAIFADNSEEEFNFVIIREQKAQPLKLKTALWYLFAAIVMMTPLIFSQ